MALFSNNNLSNWFGRSARGREQDETHALWTSVERAWSTSPLATLNVVETVMGMLREAEGDASLPSVLAVELAMAADALLNAEPIIELEPNWPLITSDANVAVGVRKMLSRRRRWAMDYNSLMDVFRRQVVGGYRQLIEVLPESCLEPEGDDEKSSFSVPLISLIERPAEAIERLLLSFYDDDVFRYELFWDLRERFATNLLIASGFSPETNPHEVTERLVMPTRNRNQDGLELAEIYFRRTPYADLFSVPVPFHFPEEVRFEHCHIIGGTGHGKTQLLQRMIHDDLVAAQDKPRSVVVIDSQGDLINKLLRLDLFRPGAPNGLAGRLVLIDPSDVEFPPSLNLFDARLDRLDGYRPADRERVLNGVVELYETFFGALLGAELTQKQGVIFRYLARLMLTIPGATIHTLMHLMEDGKAYKPQMEALDGSARHFFQTEFFQPSFTATKRQILRRLWGVLSTPAFERMFAQKENKIDLFEAINSGKIILINTAKDLLKTEGSQLFGRFFVAMLSQAALERSTIPENDRTPTFVYVDEAQEYFDDSIETILTQARKYRLGFTAAHQSLDQLSPRLRSAFLSNTSFKCAGGVSSKDARAVAGEFHTTPEFIEGMRRRGSQTEFAAWIKQRTAGALRLSVPLGFLERQPTLAEADLDALLALNRRRYCGTLADVLDHAPPEADDEPVRQTAKRNEPKESAKAPAAVEPPQAPPIQSIRQRDHVPETIPDAEPQPLGKGGQKHRYLQSLVKQLGEEQGFKATIEAPLPHAPGQIDVLLERDDLQIAVEISVTTPVEQERENLRKCLSAGYGNIALVLAKSTTTQGRYRTAVLEGISDEDRARLAILAPEDLPDFMASLEPPQALPDTTVRGYRVKVSRTTISPSEARSRRDALAKVISRSLDRQKD